MKRAPRRGKRRLLLALAGVALVGAIVAVVASTATGFQTYDGSTDRAQVPRWSKPCFVHEPRHDRPLLAPCARATGFVTYVRTKGAHAAPEVHFALIGRFGALIVKLDNPLHLEKPGIGSRVTVVGPLLRAQNGMREIEARSVS